MSFIQPQLTYRAGQMKVTPKLVEHLMDSEKAAVLHRLAKRFPLNYHEGTDHFAFVLSCCPQQKIGLSSR